MKKKILIIGGCGFIGKGIIDILSENKDNDITVCDNFENKSNKNPHFLNFLDIKKIKFINADFSLEKSYLKLDSTMMSFIFLHLKLC